MLQFHKKCLSFPSQKNWKSVILREGFPSGSGVKNPLVMQETQVLSPSWEDPLEEEMATYFSILAWKIIWIEKPCGLQSVHRVIKSQTQLSY